MKTRVSMGLAIVLLAALAACDSSRADDAPSSYDVEADVAADQDAPPSSGNGSIGAAGGGGTSEPPPEVEREDTYRAPVVTGRYVWSANPESGRVAVIDAQTFEVRGGDAGNGPSVVAGLPGATPRALVINSGASDASLLELTDTGVGARHVPLHQGADSWSLSPDGRVAIAWTDSRRAQRLDATDGLQDITVLELSDSAAPVATRLSVGYRPNAIVFDAQSRRAFAVTEDGISIVDLAPGAVRLAELIALPSTRRAQPDVAITADGTRALARLEGDQNLYDVDLVAGQTRAIPLGGVITDLDLSADGSRAVAVIRARPLASDADAGAPNDRDAGLSDAGLLDASASGENPVTAPGSVSEAVFIAVPAGLTDAAERRTLSVPNGNFGSVALSPDGSRAVLFSSALGTGLVTLVGPDLEQRSVDLIAPVRAVFVSADSAHALALQDPPAGSVKKGAFSVLSLAAVRAPKRVATDAPAELVALDPGSSERALVTVSDASTGLYGAYFVRMPSLQVDFVPLPSLPLSSGVVPAAGQGFVSQRHPEGRITFISLDAGVSRVITGFELSAKVVNE